jgi:hypothetical protein
MEKIILPAEIGAIKFFGVQNFPLLSKANIGRGAYPKNQVNCPRNSKHGIPGLINDRNNGSAGFFIPNSG